MTQEASAFLRVKKMVRSIPLIGPVMRRVWQGLKVMANLSPAPLETLPNCPDLFKDYRRLVAEPGLTRDQGGWLHHGKFYPDYITVGGASLAIAQTALKFCHGKGVDVGAGHWPLPGSEPTDVNRGPGLGRTIDDCIDGSLDYVFSSHCLEHIDAWREALATWYRKLAPGGVLFLYLPHPSCTIWNPGGPMVGQSHIWIPEPNVVVAALENLGGTILSRDDGPDMMFSFHVCLQKPGNGTSRPAVKA